MNMENRRLSATPKRFYVQLAGPAFRPSVLATINAKTEGRCYYCGSTENVGVDHLEPMARGGGHDIDNLVPACRRCNSSKCALPIEEFRHNCAIRLLGFPLPFTRQHVAWARARGLDLTDYDNFQFWFERESRAKARVDGRAVFDRGRMDLGADATGARE